MNVYKKINTQTSKSAVLQVQPIIVPKGGRFCRDWQAQEDAAIAKVFPFLFLYSLAKTLTGAGGGLWPSFSRQ
jgi:hypothetical protein